MTEPEEGQPTLQRLARRSPRSPRHTAGGTVEGVNAELIDVDDLGDSEGVPGQAFELRRRPVVPGDEPPVLEVRTDTMAEDDEPDEWTTVDDFGAVGPDDRVFTVDPVAGELRARAGGAARGRRLRTLWRDADRRAPVSACAATVPAAASVATSPSGAICRAASRSIPYVDRVDEPARRRRAAWTVKTIDNAKVRGPLLLRTRGRAVTTEDYENLARSAAPEVARVRARRGDEWRRRRVRARPRRARP